MKTYQAIWALIKANKTLVKPVKNETIEPIAIKVAQDNEESMEAFRERNIAIISRKSDLSPAFPVPLLDASGFINRTIAPLPTEAEGASVQTDEEDIPLIDTLLVLESASAVEAYSPPVPTVEVGTPEPIPSYDSSPSYSDSSCSSYDSSYSDSGSSCDSGGSCGGCD
jgi:hypothetical protein